MSEIGPVHTTQAIDTHFLVMSCLILYRTLEISCITQGCNFAWPQPCRYKIGCKHIITLPEVVAMQNTIGTIEKKLYDGRSIILFFPLLGIWTVGTVIFYAHH